MANWFEDAYNFIQAPANEKKAREQAAAIPPAPLPNNRSPHQDSLQEFSTGGYQGRPSWEAVQAMRNTSAPVGSPYMTPEEQALLQKQIQDSQAFQNPRIGGATPPGTAPMNPWGYSQEPASPIEDAIIAQEQRARAANAANPGATNGGGGVLDSLLQAITGGRGGARAMNPSQSYDAKNAAGRLAAIQRQQGANGQAGGYQYQNGKKVGYASQNIGGNTYTPTNGAQAYELANAAGKINALNRQSRATGNAGGYQYRNGQKVGQTQSYDAVNQAAKDKARKNATRGATQSQNSWFNEVTGR